MTRKKSNWGMPIWRNGDGRIDSKLWIVEYWNLRRSDGHVFPFGQSALNRVGQLVGPAAIAAARRLVTCRGKEGEVAEVDFAVRRGFGKMVDRRAQSQQDDNRQEAAVGDGCGADGPGIGLDGHAIRSGDWR